MLQSDVQIAIQYILIPQNGNSNIELIQNQQTTDEKGDDSIASSTFMLRAVYFPNLLRLIQSSLVLAFFMILIIQNDNNLDLVLDFTAIYIVSEIDDLIFKVIRRGFFCFGLTKAASDVETIVLKDEKKKNQCSIYSSSTLRSLVLVIITSAMLTILHKDFRNCKMMVSFFNKFILTVSLITLHTLATEFAITNGGTTMGRRRLSNHK